MTRKKKQETQQNTEVQLPEEQLTLTTASSVEDSTLQKPAWLTADVGFFVLCGMCKKEIWAPWVHEDAVWICGPCSETMPE